ncbi:hypothetical protein GUJ93_ZPchr0002g25975 [Zizania palustris]|uniref:Uncharacterized protein n=1 Tax=Zizania palustris TaxID=103762 RepID=A0A8J5VAQ6_ZIZPA|nr:hypothetical protein GUJ93_ZPchr0002g25975 [Zizania palustris]
MKAWGLAPALFRGSAAAPWLPVLVDSGHRIEPPSLSPLQHLRSNAQSTSLPAAQALSFSQSTPPPPARWIKSQTLKGVRIAEAARRLVAWYDLVIFCPEVTSSSSKLLFLHQFFSEK